jgi:hypothetical protein
MGREYEINEGSVAQPLRLLITGLAKTGKSTLAASFPNPYAITMQMESGSDTFKGKIRFYEADSWADVIDRVEKVQAAHLAGTWTHQTLIVDGLSFMSMLLEEWAEAKAIAESRRLGEGARDRVRFQKWANVKEQFQYLFHTIHTLPIHTVYTCHLRDRKDDKGATVGTGLNISGAFAELLPAMVDTVYMEIAWAKGGGRVYRSHLRNHGIYTAGFRRDGTMQGTGYCLPDHVDGMTFDHLAYLLSTCGVPILGAPVVTDQTQPKEVAEVVVT